MFRIENHAFTTYLLTNCEKPLAVGATPLTSLGERYKAPQSPQIP